MCDSIANGGQKVGPIYADSIIQPFTNLFVSNSVTTTNVNVSGTLSVASAMTSNAANTTFFYDTFTIPYINTQLLNVAAVTGLTSANITTLNVQSLFANSAVIYGANTLNVLGISNLNSLVTGTLNVSSISNLNSVTTPKANVGALNVSSISNLNSLVTGTLNVSSISNLNSLVLVNNLYAANALSTTNLFATGNTSTISNMVIQNFDFVVATTAGSYTNVCSITDVPNGSAIYAIYVDMMARGAGGSAQTKTYIIVSNYNATGGVWTRALPIGNPSAGGQTGLDVMTLNGTTYLRATNRNAAESVNVGMVIKVSSSSFSRVAITDLTSQTGTGATFTGFYPTTLLTQVAGRVGISTEQPAANLHVTGNVYVSNALTTTNVLAATGTFTGTAGQTTSTITGNVYVSNALQTTNIIAAGFTSNSTNTVFNFDTLTIPFVNSTTLNVTSTSNLDTVTLTGEPGLTTLAATGNAYVSNALSTTNVFASTVNTTNPIPFRNRIINGAMTIWQRNTATITTTASLYTTADRWCGALGTSGLLLSQWPGPIEAPQFPLALQVTTSTTTTGVPLIEQRIENANIPDFLNGTPVSVSFWVGQAVGTLMPLTVGLYYATAANNFATQTLAVAATKNTPTLTVANAYYSLNFTLTTSLGATNGLSLRFTTGGASATGSTFFLTGVQVEKGAFATPFEVRPYTIELRLAQRYYYQLTSPTAAVQGSAAVYSIFGTATGITTTAFWLPIQFPVPMRTPNYTVSNSVVTNFQLLPTGTTTITNVGVQTDSYTTTGATLNFVGTNIVPTASYIFRTNNLTGSTVAFFGFSCEL